MTAKMKRRSIAVSVLWISAARKGGIAVDPPADLATGSAARTRGIRSSEVFAIASRIDAD